jgi:hypothetical protein
MRRDVIASREPSANLDRAKNGGESLQRVRLDEAATTVQGPIRVQTIAALGHISTRAHVVDVME